MAFRLFIPLFLIFAAFLYLAYLNPGSVDFVYIPGTVVSVPITALAMLAFVAGAASMFILYSFKFFGDYLASLQLRYDLFRKSRVEKRLHKARQMAGKGKLQRAVTDVDKALADDPKNFDALTLKGTLLRKLGDSRKALEAHSLALAQRPSETDATMQLKEDYMAAGQIDSAYKLLEQVRGRSPKNVTVLREMTAISRKLGKFKRAIVLQKEIVKLTSGTSEINAERDNSAQLFYLRGEQLVAEGKTDEAQREFAGAVKIRPGFLPAVLKMAEIAMRGKGLVEAEGILRREFKRSGSIIVLRRLEECYRQVEKESDVEQLYRWALSLSPNEKLLKIFIAMAQIDKSDYKSAETSLKEVEQEFGQFTLFNLALGVAMRGIVELEGSDRTLRSDRFKKALEQEWKIFMHYHCSSCRHQAVDYFARCPVCGKWNSAEPQFF